MIDYLNLCIFAFHLFMINVISAFHNSGTWELVSFLLEKSGVCWLWNFPFKVGSDGIIDCLKIRLLVKGYIQIFYLDYGDTFSLVPKIPFVWLFIALVALQRWLLYQLDVKYAFLNGDLQKEILYGATSIFCCCGRVFWIGVLSLQIFICP